MLTPQYDRFFRHRRSKRQDLKVTQEPASRFFFLCGLCAGHQFHPRDNAHAAVAITGQLFSGSGEPVQEIEQNVAID